MRDHKSEPVELIEGDIMEKEISILLIEDNADDEWLILKMFERLGVLKIAVAHDGVSALTMLHGNRNTGESATSRPDIILLDLRLPKIDGLDVLKEIRAEESTRDIKVFVVTSSEHPAEKQLCKELGVIAYIAKPLNVSKIIDIILA